MGLLDRIAAERGDEKRYAVDQWLADYLIPANEFGYNNHVYPFGLQQTLAGQRTKEITNTLPGYISALRMCPPAFASELVRAQVLSQAKFTFRNNRTSRTPGRLFGNSKLGPLEKPWVNGTTGELLTRMEWHAGLAGNAYVTNRPVREPDGRVTARLRVLRPDWVIIIFGSQQQPDDAAHALDGEVIGYAYCNGGHQQARNPVQILLPDEVAHWSPVPDPEAAGIGMSWITPAVREIQGDRAATDHKLQFYANGAPQPLDAKILTPTGWSTMGEMHAGAQVIGADGNAHTVLAVYPQGEQEVYRVSFTDGTSTECTIDHVWQVSNAYDRKRGVTRTMSLSELIADGFRYASGPAKWAVPLVDPVEYDDPSELPIDPYLMGLLLGDGSFRSNGKGSGGITLAVANVDADETQRTIAPMLPEDNSISRRDRGGWSEFYFRGSGEWYGNPLTSIIRDLDLFDVIGRDKFVPEVYLRASIKDRVSLLQGLIDSDGHIEATGVRFTTTSRQLANDVVELVGSLGGVATVYPVVGRSTLSVNVRQLPGWIVPVRLMRKAACYSPTSALRTRTMVSAERIRRVEAQCIAVDSNDHLYVTDEFIVTHNTPNLVVKGITAASKEQFDDIVDAMETRHAGVRNAYRSLYLTAGADATVVGSDLRQLDFKATQGASETRIAMLSRVHPVILAASEGLAGSSLNAGNFNAARRLFADSWIYPTLQDVAASLASLIRVPPDADLWADTSDMPILREDAKDAAAIEDMKATTITKYVIEGFTPESAIAAVDGQDVKLLVHTGLVSVQLQPPGVVEPGYPAPAGAVPAAPKPTPPPVAPKPTSPKPTPPKPRPPSPTTGK